jgi:hypothetical protein
MSKLDYQEFEKWLYRDCCRIIHEFANSDNNQEVYSFCIYSDLGHGSMVLYINTMDSFNKHKNSEDVHYGLRSSKYRIEELGMHFRFSQEVEEFAMERAHEEWEEYEGWDPQIKSAITVCHQLGDQFSLLRQTEDFIAFTAIHGMDYDRQIHLMKETVHLDRLFAAFPEIARFEQWLASLHKKSRDEQMDDCLRIYLDFVTGTESEEVQLLRACRRDKHDSMNYIKDFGKEISPKLIQLLQKYGKCEELNHDFASLPKDERIRRVKEDKTLSVWTKEGKITHDLIDLVVLVGDVEMAAPLHELLQFWFTKTNAYPYDHIGKNVALLARALNSLSPDQFPYPSIGGSDNRLKDYDNFNVTL